MTRLGAKTLNSYTFNMYAGWVLAALVALLGINIVTSEMFMPHKPEKQAYVVEGVVEEQAADAAPAGEAEKPIAFYLASASPEKGEAVFKKCAACHTIDKGGANGIGPNLYGIVGAPHDHSPGFAYSDALLAFKGKPWTWDELSAWLKSPKTYANGTKMAFAGIAKPEDRAAVMVFLNSKSDSPLPLPAVPAEAAAAPAADAAAAPAADAAAAPAEAAPAEAAPAGR
jgi:cytochrome c